MKLHVLKWLLLGVLAIVPIGCESNTVVDDEPDGATVVDDDDDADTTIVNPGGGTTPPPANSNGVDVNVNPSTPPASDTDTGQSSSSDANR